MSLSVPAYLRISLTDQCSFNCFYCRSSLQKTFLSQRQILTGDEVFQIARLLCGLGVKHIRLTGGEPLLRKDLGALAERLASIDTLEVLSVTTNGHDLERCSGELKRKGVKRINISLDTLKKERFFTLTGCDVLKQVLRGIAAARRDQFKTLKLNVVLLKGFNDDEIVDFVEFAHENHLEVRFIEYFLTQRRYRVFRDRFVSTCAVKAEIEKRFGPLILEERDPLAGPAEVFRVSSSGIRLGFISSVTGFFCDECNRLRLSCDGKLFPCLHSADSVDLKGFLRRRDSRGFLRAVEEMMESKKFYNKLRCSHSLEMSHIGG